MNEGIPVDVIYLDFKKAFDSVPHQRLLLKLQAYGVSGQVFAWIKSFLKDRSQRVLINGVKSSWVKVESGIPQGSVLGPLLFLIYVNDIPASLQSKCLFFADDCKIFSPILNQDSVDRLQNDLDTLQLWSSIWQLPFNVSKCMVLHLGRLNPNSTYYINSTALQNTSEVKDLGVIIDNHLKFHGHVSSIVSKANQLLALIRKSFIYSDLHTFSYLYKAIVRPTLEYGNTIWGPFYLLDQYKIEKIQRKATRLCNGIRHLQYEERLSLLQLPSLFYRRFRGDMITTFNLIHHYLNLDSSLFFTLSSTATRGHQFKLYKPRSTREVRFHMFSNRIINQWNSLPDDIVNARNPTMFKKLFDTFNYDIMYSTNII